MRNNFRCRRDGVAERCSICDRPFGLMIIKADR